MKIGIAKVMIQRTYTWEWKEKQGIRQKQGGRL